MAATNIEFAMQFRDPDTDKIIPISAFREQGKRVMKSYFTDEAFWEQLIAPVGYLELPTIEFLSAKVWIRAKCEHTEPSAVPNALMDWANAQADVMYEFGGVDCALEIQDIRVSAAAENVSFAGGGKRTRRLRRMRRLRRKTRRTTARRC